MADDEKNTVKYKLKIIAQNFYEELQDADKGMENTGKSADNLAKKIMAKAKEMKVSLRDVVQVLDEVHMKNVDAGYTTKKFTEAYGGASKIIAEKAMYEETAKQIDDINKKKEKGKQISKEELALAKEMAKPYEARISAEKKIAASREKSLQFGYGNMQEAAQIANLSSPTKGNYTEGLERTKNLIMSISKNFGISTQEAAKFAGQMGINKVLVTDAVQQIDNKFRGLAGALKKTFSNIQNYISTAFGVSMAMILFKAQMAIGQFFTDSIAKARDFRTAMLNLNIAESILSTNGLDITREEIQGLADDVEAMGIGLGKTGAAKLVADVMEGAKNIPNMTKDMLNALIMTAAAGTTKGVTPEAVVNSFIDRKKQSLNGIVIFSEEMIKDEAIRLKLVTDVNAVLNDQQKNQALASLYAKQSADYMAEYKKQIEGSNIETENLAKQAEENLKTNFGQGWLNLIDTLKGFFVAMYPTLLLMIDLLNGVVAVASATFKTAAWYLQQMSTNIQLILSGDFKGAAEFTLKTFQEAGGVYGKNLRDAFQEGFEGSKGGLGEVINLLMGGKTQPDTKTGAGGGSETAGILTDDEKSKIKDGADDILKAMNDMYDDLSKMEDEYIKDSARAWEDYQQDLKRLKEDYEHDVLMASKESNDDLAQENADYANEELEAALKFEEEMRQLRQKFLFDLEDALAARDARQVIRLQKQYAMDFTNKTNEFDLERQERLRAHELELNDIKNQTNNKLAELKYEYDMRVIRMQEDNALERARRDQDHTDDMKRREEEMQDRITQWGLELETEYGVKTEGVQKLYDELGKFYGTDGKFNVMYRGSFQDILNMAGKFNALLDQQLLMAAGKAGVIGGLSGYIGNPSQPRPPGAGGSNLGASGIQNFMPFNSGVAPRPVGGGGGQQGSLQIGVTLSPNLQATIVNDAINGVAEVITNAATSPRRGNR